MNQKLFLTLLGVAIFYTAFFIKSPSYIWVETWFILEILVLTALTRTVSLRYGLGLLAQGVVLSGFLTILLWQLFDLMGLHGGAAGEIIMATIEELLKFAPVGIAAWLVFRKRGIQFNISDFLFLSVMCAAGFSMFEKSFWEGVVFPFTYGPHIGDLYFFSDALGMYVDGERFGYIGHAAATGLVGMSVGIGLLFKKRGAALWWILPIVAFSWITLEHILSNLYYVTESQALLAIGGGMLTPWIFLLLLVLTLVFDARNLRQFFATHHKEKAEFDEKKQKIVTVLKSKQWPALSEWKLFFRTLRAAHSLAWEGVQAPQVTTTTGSPLEQKS